MDAELRLAEKQGDVARLARLRQRVGLCGGCGQSHLTYLLGGIVQYNYGTIKKTVDIKQPLFGEGEWHFLRRTARLKIPTSHRTG